MTFPQWLNKHKKDDNSIGDFARDSQRVKDFPKDGTLHTYSVYLTDRRACKEARQAFREAWIQYEKEKRPLAATSEAQYKGTCELSIAHDMPFRNNKRTGGRNEQ